MRLFAAALLVIAAALGGLILALVLAIVYANGVDDGPTC